VLCLEIGEWWHSGGVIDGKTLIEERLNDFVVGLLRQAFKEKRQRAEREVWRQLNESVTARRRHLGQRRQWKRVQLAASL
jgi:hypothetical protein